MQNGKKVGGVVMGTVCVWTQCGLWYRKEDVAIKKNEKLKNENEC